MSRAANINLIQSNHYLEVCERIEGWRGNNGGVYIAPYPQLPHRHIAALLGYGNVSDMWAEWKEDDTKTLDTLCGPNGYAIYRMLLINRQLLPEEE